MPLMALTGREPPRRQTRQIGGGKNGWKPSLHVFAPGCHSRPALMQIGSGCYKLLSYRANRNRIITLRTPLALLLISLGIVASVWWWLAMPVTLVRAPIDPAGKLECVSYAPFRG